MHAEDFLTALTIVLGVAALTTVAFQRLRQPVVLGYILAGLIVGPHIPIPIDVSGDVVRTLSELGVILLMFGLGLEFTLAKLVRALPTAGTTAVLQASAMMWLGYLTARALGWSAMDSIFLGAVIAISSTTIIAKAFDEQGIKGKLRELVVAILIVEDLIAVLIMTILTAVASGRGLSAGEVVYTIVRLGGFLLVLVLVGLFVVPRAMRAIVKLGRPETTIVAAIGVCFGCSLLAHYAGYSVALGAFVGGVLVAESKVTRQIEPLVLPIRDIFAAVFFVSVGMLIDPAVVADHWLAIIVIALVVIAGKLASVAFGAFITGNGTRTSIAAGMSLAQIGEFSFIIAGLGVSLGVVGSQLYPVAVAVSAITTLTTPWLIRSAKPVGAFVDRTLPKPLQTVVALYEGWIERIRHARRESRSALRKFVRVLVIDMLVVLGIVLGLAIGFDELVLALHDYLGVEPHLGRIIVVAAGGLAALPFCVGVVLTTRRFAIVLAATAVPSKSSGKVDLGLAPRRALQTIVQVAGLLLVTLSLVALTQPFLPAFTATAILVLALVILGIIVWRSATNLQSHMRAVAGALVEALVIAPDAKEVEAHDVFAGIGNPAQLVVERGSAADGRSLGQLELRATTGATVLVIVRDGHGILSPEAHDVLRAGDILAITGTHDAIALARSLFRASGQPDSGEGGARGVSNGV